MTSILKVSEIQDPTNSNTALTIDSSGRILQPAKPMFKVYRSTNFNYTSAQNGQKMTGWDDVSSAGAINIGGFWDTVNDRATAPVTGMYMFEIKAFFHTGTYGQLGIGMYVNGGTAKGADFRVNRSNSSFGYDSVNFNAHLYLEANDYVEFYFIQQSLTAELHTSTGNYYSGVCGHLVA